ncbi:MAG: glycosyltransferase family 39 protein [Rikenellaceae bacterium]
MKRFLSTSNGFLVLLLALWTIFNLLQGALTGLANDEAYYWVLSSDVGFGYYDHPPVFGWLIGLSTFIFGDSEFGIRALTILLQPIYLYLFWRLIPLGRRTKILALTYFLAAFSIPLLQLYGFIVTPDAPLVFATALLLYCYKRFLGLEDNFSTRSILTSVALGLSAALICYAKYHGILVIGFIVLSNIRMLFAPRLYIALLAGVVAFIPHLVWQSSHDWASLVYHLSARTTGFEASNLWIYIVNILTTFNPFFILFFFALILKRQKQNKEQLTPQENIERHFAMALKFITWGFILFFLRSVSQVHVQAQWLIPLVFPVLYFLTMGAAKRVRLRGYILRVGAICGLLFVLVRVSIMSYADRLIQNELLNNHQYEEFTQSLSYRPFITNGNYVTASKMRFYGRNAAYAAPNVDSRSSHYEYMDMDSHLYMRPVAIEISDSVNLALTKQQKDSTFEFVKIHQYEIWYDTISNYIPSRDVVVEAQLPEKILASDSLPLDISMINPYSFDIPLGQGRDHFELFLHLRSKQNGIIRVPIALTQKTIPQHGRIKERVWIKLSRKIKTDEYDAGFTLMRYPYGSWFNSERSKVLIVNPN